MKYTVKKIFAYLLMAAMCVTLLTPCVYATGSFDSDGWSDAGHTHRYSGGQVRVEPACETAGYVGVKCTGCDTVRQDQTLPALGHNYVKGICTRCNKKAPNAISGDLNKDNKINNDDVILLLWHVLFPEDYGINVNADFNSDGKVNNADVVLLLWHVLFPEDYPL